MRKSFFFFYLCDLINKIDIMGHSPTSSAAPIPNKSTRSIVMATKIDKIKLAQTINDLPNLDSETKSQLLQLIHERKQYGLVWEEHHEEVEQQMQTQLPVLVEDKSKFIDSADPNAPNHILIEGDNLPALTALTYTHKEKIDVIYIDPPYNTGNKDFIYNDHFVGTDDDYRHSKWLSFMSKRLRIAKTLLSDKGVIFISIDDNEQAQLKMLCDEIFGAGNFVAQIIWHNNKKGRQMDKFVKTTCEYALVYALCKLKLSVNDKEISVNTTSYPYVDSISAYKKGYPLHNGTATFHIDNRPNLCYAIYYHPSTNDIVIIDEKEKRQEHWYLQLSNEGEKLLNLGYKRIVPKENNKYHNQRVWRWSKEKVLREKEELMFVEESSEWYIYQKERMSEEGTKKVKNNNYIDIDTSRGKEMLNSIFSNQVVFDFPKPVEYVAYLLKIVVDKNSTILDFFAGSGTTLHATMQLNAEDGGHRQCILITNNENHICEEVTYERNKRVIQGYTTPKGEPVAGLTANKLRYYRTDFVARESSLTAKKQLMLAATDLLCIKESIYTECHTFGNLRLRHSVVRYFADADAQMLIIYNPDAIDTIVAEISRMDIVSPIRIYVFSANDYAYNADFEAVDNKVSLCALPAAIYNAYRKVLPKKQQPQDEPATTDTELTFEEDTL